MDSLHSVQGIDKNTIDDIEFYIDFLTDPKFRKFLEESEAISLKDCVNIKELEWWIRDCTNSKS